MNRLLSISGAIFIALMGVAASASAQETRATPWLAAYSFVVPANPLGQNAKAGLAAFTLTNNMTSDVRDVVIEVLPGTRVGFGSFNREQAGNIGRGSFAVLHVQLMLASDAKGFPLKITWKDADGSPRAATIDAIDIEEARK